MTTTTRTLTLPLAKPSLAHDNLVDWPQWQSSEFISTIDSELMNFPNNAQLILTVTVLFLQLLTLALSSSKFTLPPTQHNNARAMVRSCIIKMRYSHLKTLNVADETTLWDHLIVDKTATRTWVDAFTSLHQRLGQVLPSEALNTIAINPDALSVLDTVLDNEQDFAKFILNAQVVPGSASSALVHFKVHPEAPARLQSILDDVNSDCCTLHSSRSIRENSLAWMAFESDSLQVVQAKPETNHDQKGEL